MTDLKDAKIIDTRKLSDEDNVVVTYHNPLDNVEDLAHHFFSRCLEAEVTPYVVTKKTVSAYYCFCFVFSDYTVI